MRAREFSTIGYERQMNPLLQLDEQRFVRYLTEQHLSLPLYFRRAHDLNVAGPPAMPQTVREFDSDEFEGLTNKGAMTVIDTREPWAFAGSHVPGSLSIWLDGTSFYPGWVLGGVEPVALVTERPTDAKVACNYLGRLGFDNVSARLCNGIPDWRNKGKPTARLKTCSV